MNTVLSIDIGIKPMEINVKPNMAYVPLAKLFINERGLKYTNSNNTQPAIKYTNV